MNRTNFAACLLVAFVAGVGLGGGCVGQVVGPGEEPGSPGAAGTQGLAGVSGLAGVTGTAGTNASGLAGMTGVAGTTGEAGRGGTTGAAGTGVAGRGGTTGGAGTGAAGSGAAGRGGTTGAAGTGAAGRGGTTGAAGTGAAGRGGTTGAAGTGAAGTGAAGRGGTTGAAGTGAAGRGGTTGAAGTGNVSEPPRISSGQSGVSNSWASRYWDCCKPACGWTANVSGGSPMRSCNMQNQSLGTDYMARNACESGGTAHMCWSGIPWSVSNTLSYGFAAASGDKYRCGRCYQVQFTGGASHGNAASAAPLSNKTMIVQVINNGGVQNDQFDLLIPGGGVGALNACDTQWGTTDLGATYGGFLTTCNRDANCVRQRCQTVFSNKPDLMAGCDWFLTWFMGADNPDALSRQIACPSAITQRSGLNDPG